MLGTGNGGGSFRTFSTPLINQGAWNDLVRSYGYTPVDYLSFASGGDFITNGARIIQVGEAGPERVTITPLLETRPSNLGINLETSQASKQLYDLMTKIANRPVTIPVMLELDTDSYDLKTMIEDAVKETVMDIRVR
jgi:hypothetical protein